MEKEISCINTRAILDYLKARNLGDCSEILKDLDPEIQALSDPESFLRDPNNWVSCELASKVYQRAGSLLNNETIAYDIAKFAVQNTSLGYTQRILVKAFWSYGTALRHAQKINDKWNRNKSVELVEIKRNEALVRLHWHREMAVSKHFCLMNQGAYTFMPLIWGGSPLSLEERCCYFEGAPYCEYHLKWPARNRIHEAFSRFFTSKSVLMETIKEMEADKRIVEQKYEEVNRLNLQLSHKIKQLTAIQETGKAILSVLELEELLTVIMNLLSSTCDIKKAIIMLVNEERECLEYIHGIGFGVETHEAIREYKVPLNRVSNMLVRVVKRGKSEYIPEVKRSNLRKENLLLAQGDPVSAFVVPLITRSKVIGVIATDAVDGRGVPQEVRETLEVFAPQIAIAIENARLYRDLRERMSDLKRSQALLSRAERFSSLGNMAARLAHEIKNPLTAIGTFIQLLPHKYNDEEFRRDFYKIAMEETHRVNSLISELLDLVRPKESHFAFNDLHDLIERMILLVSPQTNAKRIGIVRQFDEGVGQVWLDAEKMKQVFLNLLSNAVEFTPVNGTIEIVTSHVHQKEKPDEVRVEVRDNGVGISPDLTDKIFDPYFTTKHKSTLHSGTGLGLFIAHQHIQDHRGTIEVKSALNKGATFLLTWPSKPETGSHPVGDAAER